MHCSRYEVIRSGFRFLGYQKWAFIILDVECGFNHFLCRSYFVPVQAFVHTP